MTFHAGVDLGRADALVMDAPIIFHWPKLLLWGAVEALLAVASAMQVHAGRAAVKAAKRSGVGCTAGFYHFPQDAALTAIQSVLVVLLSLYLIGVVAHLAKAFAELRKRSYKRYRIANTLVRVQVRLLAQCTAFMCGVGNALLHAHAPASQLTQAEHAFCVLQARLKGAAMGFFALCIAVYIFVQYGSTTRCVHAVRQQRQCFIILLWLNGSN